MTRTFVLGLDGASWRLLEPWIETGELPNFEALRESGTWAESRSCLPPVTFPNWKCYASGKNPGGFGVFWFERVDLDAGEISVCNGNDFDTLELWDYLNDEGQTAGVMNMPSTYPPREIDDFIVSGGPDAVEGEYRSLEEGYTHPPELAEELEDRFGYRVHPEPLLSSNDETGAEVDAILDLFEARFEAAITLFEERDLDFMHLTLFYLNVLHHFFWDEASTRRGWKLVDEWIGRLADLEDTDLIVMSDHGSGPTQTEFYVNEWLAEHGYQARTQSIGSVFQRVGLTRENALAVAKRLGMVEFLSRAIPERVQQLVPQEAGVKRGQKLDAIDLPNTQAVASAQGPIYVNPAYDVESVVDSLIEDLRTVEDEHGRIFTDVYRGEEIYDGPYVDEAPEVVVEQRPGVHVNDGIGGGEIMTEPARWAAENTNTGIFVASGPSFEAGGKRERISITDIAPTVLANAGCAVPTDMRGDVLDIFREDPDVETRDPLESAGRRSEAGEEVSERLQQLGYME
ncbi:Phosphodiesterase of AP superfamily [Halapricum desulfuricans]|uniref:Phosphodiesterase of AP superfamily n=1 Tax=Halapricum desulfuricans TaxID=2841257 RepID=A0A897NJP7_9EURY|nr:alkaline phosphatase family protein [Halapricum desulfuricans]QSG12541.1 Phosphodiesterase of AP superfamily [Halapricum desulfuricans]